MIHPDETIQSQYAASPTITALIEGFNEAVDPRADIQLFYDKIFNPSTAEGVGLDYWGRIVALSRKIEVTDFGENFGFNYSRREPFDQGVFFQGLEQNQGVYNLTDQMFRKLIMWKAKINIGGTSLHDIEQCLSVFLDGQPVVAQDDGPMKIKITFLTEPTPLQLALISMYRSLFVGAGVSVTAVIQNLSFLSMDEESQTFDQSTFYND